MTKRVGKTPVRRAAVMPFAAPMESRPVIGSVDRLDPPWVLAEVDGERLDLAVEHDREVLERVVRVSDKMRLVWSLKSRSESDSSWSRKASTTRLTTGP